MASDQQPEFSPHLYDDLRSHLLDKDQDRAIELIYQLLSSGRPLGEVVAQVTRAPAAPASDEPAAENPPPETQEVPPAAVSEIAESDARADESRPLEPLIERAGRITADRLGADIARLATDEPTSPDSERREIDSSARADDDTPRELTATVSAATLREEPRHGAVGRAHRPWRRSAAVAAGFTLIAVAAVGAFRVDLITATGTAPDGDRPGTTAAALTPGGLSREARGPSLLANQPAPILEPAAVKEPLTEVGSTSSTVVPHASPAVAAAKPAPRVGNVPTTLVAAIAGGAHQQPSEPAPPSGLPAARPEPVAISKPLPVGGFAASEVGPGAAAADPEPMAGSEPARVATVTGNRAATQVSEPAPPTPAVSPRPEPPVAKGAATPPASTSGDLRPQAARAPASEADAKQPRPEPAPEATSTAPDRQTAVAMAAPAGAKTPGLLDATIAELISRGDNFLMSGDVTSARLYCRHGADAGDSSAALRLGETFDPSFLKRVNLGHVAGDRQQAMDWYRRAHDLGNSDAEILAKGLGPPGN